MRFDRSNDSSRVTSPQSLAAGVRRSSSASCNKVRLVDYAEIDVMGTVRVSTASAASGQLKLTD
jgi:hypothetical protein